MRSYEEARFGSGTSGTACRSLLCACISTHNRSVGTQYAVPTDSKGVRFTSRPRINSDRNSSCNSRSDRKSTYT